MQLIADRWLYVHLPKTAGTWATQTLLDTGLARTTPDVMPGHCGVRHLDQYTQRGALPVVGGMRDPWSWYVAMSYTMRATDVHWDERTAAWAQSKVSEALIDAIIDPATANRPDDVRLPVHDGDSVMRDCRANGYGLWSWMFYHAYWYRNAENTAFSHQYPNLHLYSQPDVRAQLPQILQSIGVEITSEQRQHIATAERRNVGATKTALQQRRTRDIASHYTPERWGRVREMDGELMDRLGY